MAFRKLPGAKRRQFSGKPRAGVATGKVGISLIKMQVLTAGRPIYSPRLHGLKASLSPRANAYFSRNVTNQSR
jgi:hypothetical protein